MFVPLLRAADIPVALHVDGIERRRAKWGALGRAVYALSERLAVRVADEVITDADVIARHYRSRYGAATTTITYGVEPDPAPGDDVLRRLGLESGRYLLYVSRFEPENNPHRVAQAYRAVPGTTPLVMVGDAPYARSFIDGFVRGADSRIVFPGRAVRARVPPAPAPRARLRSRHRGGRHPPGAGRGDGIRQLRGGQRHAREP